MNKLELHLSAEEMKDFDSKTDLNFIDESNDTFNKVANYLIDYFEKNNQHTNGFSDVYFFLICGDQKRRNRVVRDWSNGNIVFCKDS